MVQSNVIVVVVMATYCSARFVVRSQHALVAVCM